MNKVLRETRKDKGWTQEEVARAVGIHRTAYTRIERGERIPGVHIAMKISSVLGKPVEELFGMNPGEKK